MKYLMFYALVATLVAGCGTVAPPFNIGGSKGDAMVFIGTNIGEFDDVNRAGAIREAKKRCRG